MSNKAQADFLKAARPLAETLIAYAKSAGAAYGITDAKVSVSSSDRQENAVEKGEVVKSVSGASWNVSVVLYAGDRVMAFTCNTLDADTLKESMLRNMQVIHLVPPNKGKRLLETDKVFKGPSADFDLYDQNPPTAAQLIAYVKALEKAAMEVPGIKAARSVSLTAGKSHSLVLATNGLDRAESMTTYSAGASVVAEDQNGMEIDGDASFARHFADMVDPVALGKSAAQEALCKLSSTLPATGHVPVVLSPEAAADFFSSVLSAVSGTAVYRGTTMFKDKVGQQVLSRGITIVDDPAIPRGMSSGAMDTAGLEMKKITFVEDGVLKGYDLTLLEARQLGLEPIGRENGETNVSVLNGAQTPDALMADIADGVYIKGFSGGTVDINNGIHSRQAYGMLIKDGKVTDVAISGFVVSGNLRDMFMNVAVANDAPQLPNPRHSMSAPTTRIEGVTIAGK